MDMPLDMLSSIDPAAAALLLLLALAALSSVCAVIGAVISRHLLRFVGGYDRIRITREADHGF